MIYVTVCINTWFNLSQYTFFDIAAKYLWILFFEALKWSQQFLSNFCNKSLSTYNLYGLETVLHFFYLSKEQLMRISCKYTIMPKNKIPLLYLLINCISPRSALQMLSLKDEYFLRALNFRIIGLCDWSVNYSLSEF